MAGKNKMEPKVEIDLKKLEKAIDYDYNAVQESLSQAIKKEIGKATLEMKNHMRAILSSSAISPKNTSIAAQPHLNIKWEVGPNMPYVKKDKEKVEDTSSNVQSVVTQDTLYVGGEVMSNFEHSSTVMAYHTTKRRWSTLPPHTARNFAMTTVNSHLVVIGGVDKCGSDVSLLAEWKLGEWSYPYPPMPTARSCSSAVSYGEHLFVIGGVKCTQGTEEQPDGTSSTLTTVEILDIRDKVWYKSFPLPIPWASMKPALVDHICYFMGGSIGNVATSRVFSVSLPALIYLLGSTNLMCTLWTEVFALDITRSTPLSMNGYLYAVGGLQSKNVGGKHSKHKGPKSEILWYQPDMEKWVEVGKLNEGICNSAAAVTPAGMILVTAGEDDQGYSKEIHEGTLK